MLLAGELSDRIGRKPTYLIGWVCQLLMVFPLFWLVNRASLGDLFVALALFSIGLGLTYGPQSALFAELFPAEVRYSGVALSYALGAVVGGAFSPLIAQALVERTGTTASVSAYLLVMTVTALVATLLLPSRDRIDLGGASEDDDSTGLGDWGERGGGE